VPQCYLKGESLGGNEVITKSIRSYRRFWPTAPADQYCVEIRLFCSQEELETIRKAIFELKGGKSE
jgi:hypothetical protein